MSNFQEVYTHETNQLAIQSKSLTKCRDSEKHLLWNGCYGYALAVIIDMKIASIYAIFTTVSTKTP